MKPFKFHLYSFKITTAIFLFVLLILFYLNKYLILFSININIIYFLIPSFYLLYVVIDYFLMPIYKINDYLKKFKTNDQILLNINSKDELGELAKSLSKISKNVKYEKDDFTYLSNVRTQFIANVSHELKTPIFAIKGFVETLINGAIKDNDVNIKFLKKILYQSNRLEDLFSDLITISKIESKELLLDCVKFDLNKIMIWLDYTFSDEAKQRGIELVIPNIENLNIYGDKEQLKSVFGNLVKNAINYTQKGKVIIIIKKINKNVKVKIIDNGIGISSEHQGRIFERFFRVDVARSRDVGGTGLGLSIVKHILEAHGSSINLKSELGHGSEFIFELPIS